MKKAWGYGNVFLLGVASTLLWVKWSGNWNETNSLTFFPTKTESLITQNEVKNNNTVSVNEMVEILKSKEAVENLKNGLIPKLEMGKVTRWDKPNSSTKLNQPPSKTTLEGSVRH